MEIKWHIKKREKSRRKPRAEFQVKGEIIFGNWTLAKCLKQRKMLRQLARGQFRSVSLHYLNQSLQSSQALSTLTSCYPHHTDQIFCLQVVNFPRPVAHKPQSKTLAGGGGGDPHPFSINVISPSLISCHFIDDQVHSFHSHQESLSTNLTSSSRIRFLKISLVTFPNVCAKMDGSMS